MILSITGSSLPANSDKFLLISSRIKIGMTWQQHIFHDALPWFLSMAFTCKVFKHFKTVSQLMEQDVPLEMTVFPIKWTDEAMDSPVFRQTLFSGDPMTQSQWRAVWDPLLKEAGYTIPVTIHRIRQGVCNALEGQSHLEVHHDLADRSQDTLHPPRGNRFSGNPRQCLMIAIFQVCLLSTFNLYILSKPRGETISSNSRAFPAIASRAFPLPCQSEHVRLCFNTQIL